MDLIDPTPEPGEDKGHRWPPDPRDTAALEPDSPPPGDVDLLTYSIRMAERPGEPCSFCNTPTGRGPVGYCEAGPVCDRCLDRGDHDLGAILALIAITRIHAIRVERDPESRPETMELTDTLLGEFERSVRHWGSVRVIWESPE